MAEITHEVTLSDDQVAMRMILMFVSELGEHCA